MLFNCCCLIISSSKEFCAIFPQEAAVKSDPGRAGESADPHPIMKTIDAQLLTVEGRAGAHSFPWESERKSFSTLPSLGAAWSTE